jgi:hypothetical protein
MNKDMYDELIKMYYYCPKKIDEDILLHLNLGDKVIMNYKKGINQYESYNVPLILSIDQPNALDNRSTYFNEIISSVVKDNDTKAKKLEIKRTRFKNLSPMSSEEVNSLLLFNTGTILTHDCLPLDEYYINFNDLSEWLFRVSGINNNN